MYSSCNLFEEKSNASTDDSTLTLASLSCLISFKFVFSWNSSMFSSRILFRQIVFLKQTVCSADVSSLCFDTVLVWVRWFCTVVSTYLLSQCFYHVVYFIQIRYKEVHFYKFCHSFYKPFLNGNTYKTRTATRYFWQIIF